MENTEKIKLILPDFLNVEVCNYFLQDYKNHLSMMKDDFQIFGFYGVFPNCNWNIKNTKFDMYKLNEEKIQEIVKKYKTLKTKIIIVFDNEDLDEEDLDDEYGNLILRCFDTSNNFVIVESQKLQVYIEKNYKKITILNKTYNFLNVNETKKLKNTEDLQKAILKINSESIRNYKFMFKHKKDDVKLKKINVKKSKYYNNSQNQIFGLNFEKFASIKYEDFLEYKKQGINKFFLSGLGVYNIASLEYIIDLIYKDEFKTDASLIVFQKLLSLKEEECVEIFNYRL